MYNWSSRAKKWIAECLLLEYKRKYVKRELRSLSEQKKGQLIEGSTGGKQILRKQQANGEGIDQPTKGQLSNKMGSVEKPK